MLQLYFTHNLSLTPACSDLNNHLGFPESIKVKVKFTLEQAMKAQRGSRGVLYSFFNLSAKIPCRFTTGKGFVSIV
jgi:hypothetical protein